MPGKVYYICRGSALRPTEHPHMFASQCLYLMTTMFEGVLMLTLIRHPTVIGATIAACNLPVRLTGRNSRTEHTQTLSLASIRLTQLALVSTCRAVSVLP
jgi:hypothetical protein